VIPFIIATDSAHVIAWTPLKISELSDLNLTFGLNAWKYSFEILPPNWFRNTTWKCVLQKYIF